MTHVSKKPLGKGVQEKLIRNLSIALSRMDRDEMKIFMDSLFSETEKVMFAKRLAASVLINEKVPDYKIAEALNITRITVDKIQLNMRTKKDGFNLAFKKLEAEKLYQDFKNMLIKLASYSVRAAGRGI